MIRHLEAAAAGAQASSVSASTPSSRPEPVVASDPSQRRGDVVDRGSFAGPGGGDNAAIRRATVEVVGRAIGRARTSGPLALTWSGLLPAPRSWIGLALRAPRLGNLHQAADRPIPLAGCG
jgi:hypothetical protein